jgi:hypothetical protein
MAETNQKRTRQQNRQYWQTHDEACRRSGVTREEYCRQHQLSLKTFAYWRHRLKTQAGPVKLVQLPSAMQQSSALRLVVNGCGIEVSEGFSARTLAEVVTVLRGL